MMRICPSIVRLFVNIPSFVPHGPMVKASGYDYVTTSGWNQKIPGSTPGGEAYFLFFIFHLKVYSSASRISTLVILSASSIQPANHISNKW